MKAILPLYRTIDSADSAGPHLILGVRRTALAEMFIFLSAVVLLNVLFSDGMRFINTSLHPFWIIIVVATLQYGAAEGIAAAVMSSIFLLAGNLPEQNMMETFYEYILRIMFLPILWMASALILGSIRTRQLREKANLLEQVEKSETATQAITQAYKGMKQSKEQLELRLAQEQCNLTTAYKLAKCMETAERSSIGTAAVEMLRVALNARKCSVFRLQGTQFILEATYNDQNSASPGQPDINPALAREMLQHKRIYSIMNADDEALLAGSGVLASPLCDANGKVLGMTLIEEIHFLNLDTRTHETLRILSEWIGSIYAREQSDAFVHARNLLRKNGQKLFGARTQATDVNAWQNYAYAASQPAL